MVYNLVTIATNYFLSLIMIFFSKTYTWYFNLDILNQILIKFLSMEKI